MGCQSSKREYQRQTSVKASYIKIKQIKFIVKNQQNQTNLNNQIDDLKALSSTKHESQEKTDNVYDLPQMKSKSQPDNLFKFFNSSQQYRDITGHDKN